MKQGFLAIAALAAVFMSAAPVALAAGHAGGPVMTFPLKPGQAPGSTGSATAPDALPPSQALGGLGTMPPVNEAGQPGVAIDMNQVLPPVQAQQATPPSSQVVPASAGAMAPPAKQ